MQATAEALEAKRAAEGWLVVDMQAALGTSNRQYANIRQRPDMKLRPEFCGRVARLLGAAPEVVLGWEGYWDRLSPVGKIILPAILSAGITQKSFAEQAGLTETALSLIVTGRAIPGTRGRPTIEQLARPLNLDVAALSRAAREMQQSRPAPQLAGAPARILKREGRDGLERAADRMRYRLVRKYTPQQRRAIAKAAGAASAERWTTATDLDHLRWAVAHVKPQVAGVFGLCRVCGKLTYVTAAQARKRGAGEYHGACMQAWHANSPEWAEWVSLMRKGISPRNRGPMPEPPYPARRRPSSTELADYFRTAVRYLRVRGHTLRLRQRRHGDGPRSVDELAKSLGLTQQGLHKRLDTLARLLPDESVCNEALRPKVRALALLRGPWGRSVEGLRTDQLRVCTPNS